MGAGGFELLEPVATEVARFVELQPIAGVRWPGPARDDGAREGQVPLIEVQDRGELQEWEPRGMGA